MGILAGLDLQATVSLSAPPPTEGNCCEGNTACLHKHAHGRTHGRTHPCMYTRHPCEAAHPGTHLLPVHWRMAWRRADGFLCLAAEARQALLGVVRDLCEAQLVPNLLASAKVCPRDGVFGGCLYRNYLQYAAPFICSDYVLWGG